MIRIVIAQIKKLISISLHVHICIYTIYVLQNIVPAIKKGVSVIFERIKNTFLCKRLYERK